MLRPSLLAFIVLPTCRRPVERPTKFYKWQGHNGAVHPGLCDNAMRLEAAVMSELWQLRGATSVFGALGLHPVLTSCVHSL